MSPPPPQPPPHPPQKKLSTNSNLYKKVRKEYLQETILFLQANSDVLTCMPSELCQKVIFAFLQQRVLQHIKNNLKLQVVLLVEDMVRDDGEI